MKKSRKQNAPTSDEILARIASEENSSYGINDSELADERARAIDYYLGKPFGNEISGRSQVISTDVADTVEAILPQLVKVFCSGDQICAFNPRGPEDVEAASQETEVINHIALEKNDGFVALYTMMKDALLSKNGYCKIYYEEKEEVEKEFYAALNDDEFAMIASDNEVEVIEHDEYLDETDAKMRLEAIQGMQAQLSQLMLMNDPQAQEQAQQMSQQLQQLQSMPPKMLHDVRVQTKETNGCIEIEPVAPESMMVAYDTASVSLQDARFVQHREYCTVADLREDGFDVSDEVGMDDSFADWEAENLARDVYGEQFDRSTLTGGDRRVLVRDTYMRVEGELMRYVVVGNEIIHEEEAEVIPFACLTPVIMPHRHVGRSIADLVSDLQLQKSTVLRGQFDGLYLSLNPRTFVSDRVNLDDMLVSRPGGLIRVQGAVGDAAMPMVTPDVSGIGYPMLEYLDGVKEKRTGISNQMSGIDANVLNTTATQANIMQNAAMDRITLIARIFAETGIKEIFRLVHRLMRTHSNKEMVVQLRGKFITVDPRTWKNRYDMTISVGLGNGNKDQQMVYLNNMLQIAMNANQAGVQIMSPKGLYNLVSKITTNAGFKNPEEFWQDPTENPAPPQKNPLLQVEELKQQGKAQEVQFNAQMDQQKFQAEAQMQMQIEQMKADMKLQEVRANLELQAANDARDSEREQQKAMLDAQLEQQKIEFEKWKAELAAQTQIYLKQMELGSAQPLKEEGDINNALAISIEGFRTALEQMNKPKQIIRGPDGKAVGVAPFEGI